MATLTLRTTKGSPLTSAEVDNNFIQLDLTKVQLAGDIGGTTSAPTITALQGRSVSSATPSLGQSLVWSGSAWIPSTASAVSSGSSTSTVTSTVTPTISSTTTTYPTFSAYPNSSVTQTIPTGLTQTKVLFQNEEWDNNGNFANSRFTPTVAGYYQLNAVVRIDGPMGTSETMIVLWKNGSEYHRGWNNQNSTDPGTAWFSMQVSALVYANGTTDYFEVAVQHGYGASRTVTVAGNTGFGNITWFNGIYVPTQLITAVTSTATVTSTITTTGSISNVVTVLDPIRHQFDNLTQVFTLKNNQTTISYGVDYRDNKDFLVEISGRTYDPYVDKKDLGPWIVDMTAQPAYTYRVTTSGHLVLFRAPQRNESAHVRINTVSSQRQTKSRYPFTPNTIAFGD
jgi:hypothetical protein